MREDALRHPLSATEVLDHMATGIVVTDQACGLLYANSFAVSLFGFPDDPGHLIGRSLLSLGIEQGDASTVQHMADNVLRGWPWEGTFASQRLDGSRVFVRAHAAPMRQADGTISGIVIMAREVTRRGGQRASDRIGLLERIGERLSSSLELNVTMRQVAETLVPQFADHCFIDLFHGDVLVRRAQLHARGWIPAPGTWALTGEQIYYPPGHFCAEAMSRLDTVVVDDMEAGNFPPPSKEGPRECADMKLTSVIAAPLIARGQLLGVMSLALSMLTEREERHYGADDRDFLSAIASRIALAIDNAMLFEEERRTALAFQTSLLPKDPPFVDGLEVAYKYVPAKPLETHGQGIQTQVGGDWYDIIPLSAGRVGIVIGDVEGRGARAAAVMGQLRAALRAFAQDDKSPAEILRRLDDWVRALGPAAAEEHGFAAADPPTVSCTYLVYDAWSRTLSFANAGHVPPLIVRGHDVSQLEIMDRGVLLGVRGKGVPGLPTYREENRYLAPGSTLVFYTDGLIDRRQRADGSGHYTDGEVQQMLRQAVRDAADGTVEQIAAAAETAVPGEIDDDMAVVVVRTSPVDLASWEGQFPAEPIRVSEARRLAHETFMSWGMDMEQADLTCLLVSEVVTNVVLHAAVSPTPRHELVLEGAGAGPLGLIGDWEIAPFEDGLGTPAGKDFTLRLRRGHEAVWVEVFDADLRLPRIRSAGESDEGGRGLYLVDQLASRWGSRPTKDGKAVWFEMPIKTSSRSGLA
ncbi:MAG TPA: SpoIIE family protein phosphatase [Streptosporangiaceae bacterium]|jgi:PAS domain S-box-containing protein|nr:SpoIIE family protein phosphatase [Streptosporangiaceae bacterium]